MNSLPTSSFSIRRLSVGSSRWNRYFTAISTAVWVLCAGSWVSAASIALVNADFELGSAAPPVVEPGGSSHVGSIPGWNVVSGGGVFEPNFVSEVSYPASVQATVGDFVAYSTNTTGGLVSQLLDAAFTYQLNKVYTLSADFGHRLDAPFGGGFGFYRLTNPFPTAVAAVAAVDPGPGNFQRQTFVLNSPGTDTGGFIRIGFFGDGTLGRSIDFDNVTLTISTIPEPSALLLFGIGLAVGTMRRCKH